MWNISFVTSNFSCEIWLLERAEPLYKIYPWKALLRAGSRGCAETDYGQKLMLKMMMSYDSEPKEYARLAGFGYRMLAEAIKADLQYRISCPVLLICGEKYKAGSAKRYNRKWHQRFHFRHYCSYIGIGNISRNLYDVKWN